MFLVGGPAFSGSTLLAHLLNQDGVVCLDEPDFHDHRKLYSLLVRYEDLVLKPETVMAMISETLAVRLGARTRWDPESVARTMVKMPLRHGRLLTGRLDTTRVRIWRRAGKTFTAETHETACLMGYERQ